MYSMVETLTNGRKISHAVPVRAAGPGRRPSSRLAWASAGIACCILAAGCIGGHGAAPATTSAAGDDTTRPGSVNDDPATAASVERAYRRFWATAQAVDRRPPEQWRTVLSTVTGEPLLDELLDGLAEQRDDGIVMYGTVEPRPTVAQIAGGRATVMDCQDASRSGELDSATGAIERVGAARTAVAAVLRYDTRAGAWKVTEARYLDEPC